ncbi:MAG TPA: hypothetical protein VHV52_05480 [Gaiellaceae bacterium]|nr:hypothetical protein [Gaiellaceae bacterium]
MAPKTGTPEQYAEEMGALWTSLTRTLGRLDRIASDPERLDELHLELSLARLRYALHVASEHAYGVAPPEGAESAHAELADSLAQARDATAEVAEAAADAGAEGVEPLLHEWRGALFRVRLARLRLAVPAAAKPLPAPPPEEGIARPLAAFLLALAGALAFVAGATLALWPVWVAGLLAVCASVLCYRP